MINTYLLTYVIYLFSQLLGVRKVLDSQSDLLTTYIHH